MRVRQNGVASGSVECGAVRFRPVRGRVTACQAEQGSMRGVLDSCVAQLNGNVRGYIDAVEGGCMPIAGLVMVEVVTSRPFLASRNGRTVYGRKRGAQPCIKPFEGRHSTKCQYQHFGTRNKLTVVLDM